MDFEHGKAYIMDALLKHRGIQYLVDAGSDVIGNPIFVCDLSAQIMALSHATVVDDALWDEFFPSGHMDPDIAEVVGGSGTYDRIFSHDAPVFGKFDFYPGRFIGARIRFRNDVIGMATIVERNPLGEFDGELLVVLCQAIALELTWQNSYRRTVSALQEVVSAAIEGTISGVELDLKAKNARIDVPSRARVIVIELGPGHAGILLPFAWEKLEGQLPTSTMIERHGRLVIFLDATRSDAVPIDKIVSCFVDVPLRVGAGCVFEGMSGFAESYRQARAAMRLAQLVGSPAVLADYADWRVDDFMDQAVRAVQIDVLLDPVVAEMQAYDRSEGMHLVETLETYLRCAHNAQAAARILGIHKNTMYARLERIQELFDIDLGNGETCFSLWLSLKLNHARQQSKSV